MTDRKRSKTEEQSFDRMLDVLGEQVEELDRLKRGLELIPPGWHRVAREAPVTPPKTKVSLKLDGDTILVHALDEEYAADLESGEMRRRVRRFAGGG